MENRNEMDITALLRQLKKKLWVTAASGAACALLAFAVSAFFVTPQYSASTRVYVLSRSDTANVEYADLQTATQILNDYKVLVTGENVTANVIGRLGLDMEPEELAKTIRVTSPANSRVVQITVTHSDPQMAAGIANCIREEAAEQLRSVLNVEAVKLIYAANVPREPSSPHVLRNTVLAGALGLAAAAAVQVVLFALGDTNDRKRMIDRNAETETQYLRK